MLYSSYRPFCHLVQWSVLLLAELKRAAYPHSCTNCCANCHAVPCLPVLVAMLPGSCLCVGGLYCLFWLCTCCVRATSDQGFYASCSRLNSLSSWLLLCSLSLWERSPKCKPPFWSIRDCKLVLLKIYIDFYIYLSLKAVVYFHEVPTHLETT